MAHARFLGWLCIALALLLAAMAAFNVAVDPYDIFGAPRVEGLNAIKPRAVNRPAPFKVALAARAQANTLILGNSRAEIGFDPGSAAWPQAMRPVINAAVPGSALEFAVRTLHHTIAHTPPRTVVLGLDLFDFLDVERVARAATPAVAAPRQASGEAWFARHADGAVNRGYPWDRFYGQATHAISLDALVDSVITLAAQRSADAPDIRADGFNPLREYPFTARQQGYHAMFQQRDRQNARNRLGRKYVFDPQAFALLDGVAAACRDRGIALRLAIYPYHVRLNELIVEAGLWNQFEDWKRRLTQSVALAARAGTDVVLWDFSGYGELNAEAVPARGDRATVPRWYWEAGHFKSALGDRMIGAMFAPAAQPGLFGARLAPESIEPRIAALRAERERYLGERGGELADLRELLRQVAAAKAAAAAAKR